MILIGNLNQVMTPREIAIAYAWGFQSTWYKWGGNDPSGFDCSGFVCEILQAVGLIGRKEDYTAQGLWEKFKVLQVPNGRAGAMVFYGKDVQHITHIEFCISEDFSIGASGGGSGTLTVTNAINDNAFIKIRPIKSRQDIVGYIDPFKGT